MFRGEPENTLHSRLANDASVSTSSVAMVLQVLTDGQVRAELCLCWSAGNFLLFFSLLFFCFDQEVIRSMWKASGGWKLLLLLRQNLVFALRVKKTSAVFFTLQTAVWCLGEIWIWNMHGHTSIKITCISSPSPFISVTHRITSCLIPSSSKGSRLRLLPCLWRTALY